MKKEQKIKRLKTKHIWPSVVILIISILFSGIFITASLSLFIANIFESKISTELEDAGYILEVVDADGGKVVEPVLGPLSKFKDIFIIDKDNNIVDGSGEFTADVDKVGYVMFDDTIRFCFDKSVEDSVIDEDGSIKLPVKTMISNAFTMNGTVDNQVFKESVYDISIWSIMDIPSSGNTLLVKSSIGVTRKDVVLLLVMGILLILVIILPLFVMFFNVVANVITVKRMQKLLYFDAITGGNNWLYFKDRAKRIMAKGIKKSYVYAVYDLELMKYRSFCACCGVTESEHMLEVIYSRINNAIGKKEVCVRNSGANFAILLKCDSEESAKQRILAIEEKLKDVAGEHRAVFHVGCYMVLPDKVDRKNIDVAAMYNSACSARMSVLDSEENAYAIFTDKLLEEQQWEHKVEDTMEKALNNHEFEVYYQPKYNPVTEELAGAEALIRWITPDGIIPPGKFIPIFEKNGFITKIDDYMISNVSKQQAIWLKEGRNIVPVSVNVSRAHFTQDGLAEHILELVDQYEIPHKYIEIELTESAFFDDKKVLLNVVNRLKGYGFEISMDDFGAGYSSLNSLKDLPLDVLKLDADFFRGEDNDPRAEIVVSEAISLAKQLNMRIVAEGIEKKNQVEFLAGLNCDMIQGYYYAKPMPAKDYEERMK